jgi:fused signal recognition particle receptor
MADIFNINKWKESLEKTRKVTFGKIATFVGSTQITNDTWEELEASLIQADIGVGTVQEIISSLQNEISKNGYTKNDELQLCLKKELIGRLDRSPFNDFPSQNPAVVLLVGVNGSGKTTTAAKLAKKFNNQGKKVLLGAADTYRAAAVDQLLVWGERLNIPVISGQPNADPGAVTFDAIQAAVSRKFDLLIVDTAGRLHTRYNLMEELKKVYRVAGKALSGSPHAVWLVLDATTGQNALQQARTFKDAVQINGIIIAKLDSSAKGGMLFAIQKELGIPILYVGLGEKPEDLQPFDPELFVNSLLSKN